MLPVVMAEWQYSILQFQILSLKPFAFNEWIGFCDGNTALSLQITN